VHSIALKKLDVEQPAQGERKGRIFLNYKQMNRTLDLRNMHVSAMTEENSEETNGGWLPVAAVVALVVSAISNFGDIREGVVDGWNGKPRH